MTLEEQFTLSWYDKWRKHGRFPFKFIFHLIVTIMTTTLIFMIHKDTQYVVASMNTFYHSFFPDGYQPRYGFAPGTNSIILYDVDDTINAINNTVFNFYNFPYNSIDGFYFGVTNDTEPIPPLLTVTIYSDPNTILSGNKYKPNRSTKVETYELTMDNLGPFSLSKEEVHFYLLTVVNFEIKLQLYNTQLLNKRIESWIWYIELQYDYSTTGGQGVLSMFAVRESQDRKLSPFSIITSPVVSLSLITIIFSTLSILLSIKSFAESLYAFQATKKVVHFMSTNNNNNNNKGNNNENVTIIPWRNISWLVKLKFFSPWVVTCIVGDICIIIACFSQLFSSGLGTKSDVDYTVKLLLGTGGLLTWLTLTRYLEVNKSYALFLKTLSNGMPNVGRFAFQGLLIFIGYSLCGMLLFSTHSARFLDFDESMVTLFSIINGDDLQNTFRAIVVSPDINIVLSNIYLYTFLFLYIYAVSKIAIAIIEDAYFLSGQNRSSGMLDSNTRLAIITGNRNGKESSIPLKDDHDQLWNILLKLSRPAHQRKLSTYKQNIDTINILNQSSVPSTTSRDNDLLSELSTAIQLEQSQFQDELEKKIVQLVNDNL